MKSRVEGGDQDATGTAIRWENVRGGPHRVEMGTILDYSSRSFVVGVHDGAPVGAGGVACLVAGRQSADRAASRNRPASGVQGRHKFVEGIHVDDDAT
jgi:hypothetical protein